MNTHVVDQHTYPAICLANPVGNIGQNNNVYSEQYHSAYDT